MGQELFAAMQKDRMKFMEGEWGNIEKKVLLPIWHIYEYQYTPLGIEYGDFVNISFIILLSALKDYTPGESSLYTFMCNVLKRKMYTYIRNTSGTDKTCANVYAESLDAPVSDDIKKAKIDTISASNFQDGSDIGKIQKYLKKISNTEKDVVIFRVLGFEKEEIIEALGITSAKYSNAIKSLQIYEKVSLLRNRG